MSEVAESTPIAIPAARPYRADQPAVFRRLRYQIARNGLRVMMESSRIRLFTMLATSAVVGLFVFALSLYAFDQLFRFKVPVKD